MPSESGTRRAGRGVGALGIVISVVALAGVIWWISRQDAPRLPSGAGEWSALVGAVVVYGLATVLRSERWLALLRHEGSRPPRADAYALTLVGFMANNVLPARAGDALRVVLMAPRAGAGARPVIGTLVAERVLDVFVLFSLFGILAVALARTADVPLAGVIAGALLLVGAVAVVALVTYATRRPDGRLARWSRFIEPMLTATRALRGRWAGRMLAVTLAIWACEAAVWLLSGTAIGVDLGPHEALYMIAFAATFALVPSGPGYAGTLDAAVLLALGSLDVHGRAAVSYLLMLRFVLLVPITLAGLIALLTRYGGTKGLARARSQAELA
jgi:uncharacterized protein (TIRG00374 family)